MTFLQFCAPAAGPVVSTEWLRFSGDLRPRRINAGMLGLRFGERQKKKLSLERAFDPSGFQRDGLETCPTGKRFPVASP